MINVIFDGGDFTKIKGLFPAESFTDGVTVDWLGHTWTAKTGEIYGSQVGASASNQYWLTKSKYSNGYYILTNEDAVIKNKRFIFVAEQVLSGTGTNDGAEWGGYKTTNGSGATGEVVGTSKSNTDILISAKLSPQSSNHAIAVQWVRRSGRYIGSNNPTCPTTFDGVEDAGICDLPCPQTLYTIWQVRDSLPQIKNASGASANNSWPRGGTFYNVWTSRYWHGTHVFNVSNNGNYGGTAPKTHLLGVIAVKEIGY